MIDWSAPAVQAAVIGTIGVLLTALVAASNIRRQLEHDRDQKARDRHIALRRDILLGMAEAMNDLMHGLGHFADLNLTHAEIVKEMDRATKYLAQLHLIASPEVVAASVAAERSIRKAHVAVRLRRNPLLRIRDQRDRALRDMKRAQDASDRHVDEWKALRIGRSADEDRINSVWKAHEIESEFAARMAAQADALQDKLAAGHVELVEFAQAQEQAVLKDLLPLIRAARAEFGEGFDSSTYARILEQPRLLERDVLADLLGAKKPTDVTTS